jgi:hypothetical protein
MRQQAAAAAGSSGSSTRFVALVNYTSIFFFSLGFPDSHVLLLSFSECCTCKAYTK